MKIAGSKVLVTGGAGFIGSHVVDQLLAAKVSRVVVLDNLSRGRAENLRTARKTGRIKFIQGDIRNREVVEKAFRSVDFVIHEAAVRITQCAADPRLCQEVLVDGTFNVLEACVKNKVKKLVFNSSSSVYGEPSYLPMDEKHPYNNKTAYGAGKIANEHMARAFRHMYGLNYIGLRPFSVYGPRMDLFGVYTEVMIRWLDNIDKEQPPVIFGDGKNTTDFIYVEDVARETILALKHNVNEGFYNAGFGKETDLNTLAKLILCLTESHLVPIHKGQDKLQPVNRRRADTSKARKDLRFQPKVKLEDGLKKLIIWRKNEKREKG